MGERKRKDATTEKVEDSQGSRLHGLCPVRRAAAAGKGTSTRLFPFFFGGDPCVRGRMDTGTGDDIHHRRW